MQSVKLDEGQFVDTIRISPARLAPLLEELARRDLLSDMQANRVHHRHLYIGHPVALLTVQYPTNQTGYYRAIARDLSESGLGFLHGKFIYPGSTASIALKTAEGIWRSLVGEVIRCELIHGRIHDVGLKFNTPLDLKAFELDTCRVDPSMLSIESTDDDDSATEAPSA